MAQLGASYQMNKSAGISKKTNVMRKWWQLSRPRCSRGRGERHWLQELVDTWERESSRGRGDRVYPFGLKESLLEGLAICFSFVVCIHKTRTRYISLVAFDVLSCPLDDDVNVYENSCPHTASHQTPFITWIFILSLNAAFFYEKKKKLIQSATINEI